MSARVPPPPVVDAALAVRRLLLRAADAILPPSAALFDRSMGIARTHVLATLAELGVPAALAGGPLDADQLSARVGAHPDTLRRVLRLAELDGLLRRDRRRRYRLTRLGTALRPDVEGSLHPWVRYMALESTRAAWAELTGSARTGEPGFRRARATTVWEWFAEHPEEERLFADAMANVTAFDAPVLAAADLWPDTGIVCDVAGGTGQLLAEIVAPRPGLRGVLLEAPGVLAEARPRLAARGLAERVELVEGDLLGELSARADVYVLKNILHDWDDATSGRILRTVRATMPAGSALVVVEQLQHPDRPHPFATVADLQMLTQCEGGRERSADELRALLREAGLRPSRLERAGVSALVEGVAA